MINKNLLTSILGAIIMILGCICFFTNLLVEFDFFKFVGAEFVGLVLFRLWMSKDKTLGLLERIIK